MSNVALAYRLGQEMGAGVARSACAADFEDVTQKRGAFYEAHDRLLLSDPRYARALRIGYKRGLRNAWA